MGAAAVPVFGAPLAMLLLGLEGIGGPMRVQVSPVPTHTTFGSVGTSKVMMCFCAKPGFPIGLFQSV